jgi:endonuclease I
MFKLSEKPSQTNYNDNMKILITLLTTSVLIIGSSKINTTQTTKEANDSFVLNYDDSLKSFQDLTRDEIKTYYTNTQGIVNGIKGEELQTLLEKCISVNQTYQSYSQWKYYYLLDRNWATSPLTETEISTQKWNQTGINIAALYDDQDLQVTSTNTTPQGAIGQIINREHVWVKSRGLMRDSEGDPSYMPSCDLQNLHAGEATNNQTGHNNYPYGNVKDKTTSATNKSTSKISGNITGWRGVNADGIEVYEPLDKDKGNIARTIFYMATRYHTYNETKKTPALIIDNSYEKDTTISVESTAITPANYGLLDTLLEWNQLDPVDDLERHRNNLCYNIVTKNRNPFIDYPGFANIIYGNNKKGIDLNTDSGEQAELQLEGLDNPFYIHPNESIPLDNLVIKFEGNIIDKTNCLFEISNQGNVYEYVEGQTISTSGDYTLKVKYLYNDATYVAVINFKVKDKVDETLTGDNGSTLHDITELESGNTYKLDDVTLNYTDEYGVVHTLTKDDYTIQITTPDGKTETYSSDYIFSQSGTYTITYIYNINGQSISVSRKINVSTSFFEANKIWIILLIVGFGILFIVGTIYKIKHPKKRRKRRK